MRLQAPALTQQSLARVNGALNIAGGVWSLVHLRSFEAVMGPKVDRWLVRTVAGLLVVNGLAQIRAGRSRETVWVARHIGLGTAATLGTIDLIYAPRGTISRMYLLDALLEFALVGAWLRSARSDRDLGHLQLPDGARLQ